MAQCNFCNVRMARTEAKKRGCVYVLVAEPSETDPKAMRGYQVPLFKALNLDDPKQQSGWYMEVPTHCTCDED